MEISNFVPWEFNNNVKSFLLICGSIAILSFAIIGPASSFSTSLKMVSPVILSPLSMACSIGAAPRHRGKSETCMLMHPKRGS